MFRLTSRRGKAAAFASLFALLLSTQPLSPASAATEIDYSKFTLGSGTPGYTEVELRQGNAKDQSLAAIKKWRQDALDTGVKWCDARLGGDGCGTTMKQYLANKGISEAEYLNVRWSTPLEYTTLERSIEIATAFKGIEHERPNGDSIYSLTYDGLDTNAESLAQGPSTYTGAIDLFATEKDFWDTPGVESWRVGHYSHLINPRFKSYGLSLVDRVTTMHSSGRTDDPAEPTGLTGKHEVRVQLPKSILEKNSVHFSPSTITLGHSVEPLVQNKPFAPGGAVDLKDKRFTIRGTWTSNTPGIVQVVDGKLKGVKAGAATVTLTAGDGSETFNVTVQEKMIKSIASPDAVTTASGTAPSLPSTLKATFDDGSTEDVSVTWSSSNEYKKREGGSYQLTGTVAGWSGTAPTITVNVTPAVRTGAVFEGTTDTEVTVTTDSGVEPTGIPQKATVTWSNGDTTTEDLTWDIGEKYFMPKGGSFTLTKTIGQTELKVVVNVKAATAQSAANPEDVNTIAGVQPSLPSTVEVTWSDRSVTEEKVTWDTIADSDLAQKGTLSVRGHAAGLEVTITVQVFQPSGKLSATTRMQGEELTIYGYGFVPGQDVSFYLHSDPVRLGDVTADSNGDVVLKTMVPKDTAVGSHVVTLQQGDASVDLDLKVTKAKDSGKDKAKDPGKDKAKDPGKDKAKDSGKDKPGKIADTGAENTPQLALLSLGLLGLGAAGIAARRYAVRK